MSRAKPARSGRTKRRAAEKATAKAALPKPASADAQVVYKGRQQATDGTWMFRWFVGAQMVTARVVSEEDVMFSADAEAYLGSDMLARLRRFVAAKAEIESTISPDTMRMAEDPAPPDGEEVLVRTVDGYRIGRAQKGEVLGDDVHGGRCRSSSGCRRSSTGGRRRSELERAGP